MNKTIFLDLDAIIRDFIQGVIDRFKLDISHEDVTEWHFVEKLNIPDFWEQLGFRFWVELPKTPFADEILEIVKPYRPVILTCPTPHSAGATQLWIQRNLPDYFAQGRYLIGPAKWGCAGRGKLLIDDADHNCEDFVKHGGEVILFPRPWNKNRHMNPMVWFKNRMEMLNE